MYLCRASNATERWRKRALIRTLVSPGRRNWRHAQLRAGQRQDTWKLQHPTWKTREVSTCEKWFESRNTMECRRSIQFAIGQNIQVSTKFVRKIGACVWFTHYRSLCPLLSRNKECECVECVRMCSCAVCVFRSSAKIKSFIRSIKALHMLLITYTLSITKA